MINAKELSEEQVGKIREWADAGCGLSEIQRKLVDELELNATYMDTRFLVLDLGIELKREEAPEEEAAAPGAEEAPEAPVEEIPVVGGAGVVVTTDELARPGAMVSGTVTFSDGQKGVWFIDQMGRPGLDPDTPGYQPNDEDLLAFERELRKVLQP